MNFELIIKGKILKQCYISKSKIHGYGAFAGQHIMKKSKIGSLSGKIVNIKILPNKFKINDSISIVELTSRKALDSRRHKNQLCYINHSCKANCFMRIINLQVEIYALKNIKPGDELTLNYGYSHHEGKLKCNCNYKFCIGKL